MITASGARVELAAEGVPAIVIGEERELTLTDDLLQPHVDAFGNVITRNTQEELDIIAALAYPRSGVEFEPQILGGMASLVDGALIASITIDAITGDDIIDSTEAKQNITITGTVGGDVKPGDTVTVTVNGKKYNTVVNEDGVTWEVEVPGSELIQDDTVHATVTTEDDDGNSTTAETEHPYEPVEPEIPVEPEQPVDPEEPETPVDPEEPVDPEDPEDPEIPVDPEQPVDPEEPETPVVPPYNGKITIITPEKVTEGDDITITVKVDNPPVGSNLEITLNDGTKVTIPVGETEVTTTVPSRPDDVYKQPDEDKSFEVADTSGGGYDNLDKGGSSTTTIVDNSDPTKVTLSAAGVEEGQDITIVATVEGENAPKTGLVITLDNGETITIKAGKFTGEVTFDNPNTEDVYVDAGEEIFTVDTVTGGGFENVTVQEEVKVNVKDTTDTTTATLSGELVDGEFVYTVTLSNKDGLDVSGHEGINITLSNGETITIVKGETTGSITTTDLTPTGEVTITGTEVLGGVEFENLEITGTAEVPNNAPVIDPEDPDSTDPSAPVATVKLSESGFDWGIQEGNATHSIEEQGSISFSDIDGDDLTVSLVAPTEPLYVTNGNEVEWLPVDNNNGLITLVGQAEVEGEKTDVITITINQQGEYTVELHEPLKHSQDNKQGTDDLVNINVGVTVSDGSVTTTSSIAISVEDDAPTVGADIETNFIEATGEGTVIVDGNVWSVEGNDFGADDMGAYLEFGDAIATINGDPISNLSDYGQFTFDPEDDGYWKFELDRGSDAFKALKKGDDVKVELPYTLVDGDGDRATAYIRFDIVGETTVTVENSAPVLDATAKLTGTEDKVVTGKVKATDADGDTLTYHLVGENGELVSELNTEHGKVTINTATGEYTYTPVDNWNSSKDGAESFDIQVSDGVNDPVTQTVTVNVTAVQDAFDDRFNGVDSEGKGTVFETHHHSNEVVSGGKTVILDVLKNDTWDGDNKPFITHINDTKITPNGDAIAVENGSVTLNADGTLSFTPASREFEFDIYTLEYESSSFSYTATTEGGTPETAQVKVELGNNNTQINIQKPGNVPFNYLTDENGSVTAEITFSDKDGFNADTPPIISDVKNGTVEIVSWKHVPTVYNGISYELKFKYTPNPDFNSGTGNNLNLGSFIVQSVDNLGGRSDREEVKIYVRPAVDVQDDTASTNVNEAVMIDVSANDEREGGNEVESQAAITATALHVITVEGEENLFDIPGGGNMDISAVLAGTSVAIGNKTKKETVFKSIDMDEIVDTTEGSVIEVGEGDNGPGVSTQESSEKSINSESESKSSSTKNGSKEDEEKKEQKGRKESEEENSSKELSL